MKRALEEAPIKKTRLAWDEKTELITGVRRHSDINQYQVSLGKGEQRHVNGLDEALVLREVHNCMQRLIAQLEPEEERRKRNKDRNGGGSAQERAFADRLRVAFELFGWECHILNDFTLADVLVRPRNCEYDSWFWLQLKTAAQKTVGTNYWHFGQVSHYGKMVVVCHALQGPDKGRPCTWMYNGKKLARHLPSGGLNVTSGGVWDNPSEGRLLGKCDADDLAACARKTAQLLIQLLERDDYPRTTKQHAQWTFESPAHFTELASLHMLMQRADPAVCTLTLPEEQQPHHDLVETCTGRVQRLQEKGAHPFWRKTNGAALVRAAQSGLQVNVTKNIGDRKWGPYGPNDFDALVVTWRDVLCDRWHVWRIPMADLPLDKKTGNLYTAITVHVPMNTPLPPGVERVVAHGPRPHLKGNHRGGTKSESYAWSIKYHSSFPMHSDWEPPVPWPDELAHMRRKPRLKLRL